MAGEQKYRIADELQARRIGALVSGLLPSSGPWEVIVRKWRKQRSLPQNAMMWSWYEIIGNELGYTREEMHDALREKFLPFEEVMICGVVKRRLTSTSDPKFTTAMMTAYLNHIDRFAAQELGILLPHPEDQFYEGLQR